MAVSRVTTAPEEGGGGPINHSDVDPREPVPMSSLSESMESSRHQPTSVDGFQTATTSSADYSSKSESSPPEASSTSSEVRGQYLGASSLALRRSGWVPNALITRAGVMAS